MLHVPRGGTTIPAKVKMNTFKRVKENDPIGANRIIGVDTESLTVSGMLKTVLVPYSSTYGDVCQSKPIEGIDDPIEILLDFTMSNFGEKVDRESRVLSRPTKGTRNTIPPVVWVFYNMEYDLQRLFNSESKFFRTLRHGRSEMFIDAGKYRLQIVQCNPSGSAPSFQIIVIDPAAEMVCRIYGIDMWGYWKTGLGNTAKSLGVGEKLSDDVPSEWFQIPLEEWTEEMWDKFTAYAGRDASLTHDIYLATADLLGSFSLAVFNKQGILPSSAPAAAARMAFAMASESEWERPGRDYEQLALDSYHGGYVAMRRRGFVTNLTVADLHSAYPSAMLLLPDPCRAKYIVLEGGVWKDIPTGVRKLGNLGFVRATFKIKECAFPSISKMSKKYTLHQPGVYKRFPISLPELSALFDLGQIDAAEIHGGYIVVGDTDTSFLKKFVEWFYELKETEEREGRKDSAQYLAAKLLMNALYGKLIEIHKPSEPAIEDAYELEEPIVLPPNTRKSRKLFTELAQVYTDHGTKGVFDYSSANVSEYIKMGVQPKSLYDLEHVKLREVLQDEQATAGAYFMPIHASLITSMTRAKLAIALNCFDAVGGDTDSFFTDLQPGTEAWVEAEKQANEYCIRAGVGPLEDQPGLLGYGVEMVGGEGYIAGIKQYTLAADGYKPKLAHHAITDPPGKTTKERKAFCANAVKRLALGESVFYETRSKPRRLRESLKANDGLYGVFVTRVRTVQPKADMRLQFSHKDSYGTIHFKWRDLAEVESTIESP